MIRKIFRLLQTYENCKMERKIATQILNLVVKEGMLPPDSFQSDLKCECGCQGRCTVGHNWDSEGLPEGARQIERFYR